MQTIGIDNAGFHRKPLGESSLDPRVAARIPKGKIMPSNLLAFLDKVSRFTEDDENVGVIYLNFAKAFDKVPHQRLLQKIME